MGLFDLFGKRQSSVILDAATMSQWPERLLRKQGLDEEMNSFIKGIVKGTEGVSEMRAYLAEPALQQKVPERAAALYEEHLPLILNATEELLASSKIIDDIFLIEEQQRDFQESLSQYREKTAKSHAALKEFFPNELEELNAKVKELEDAMISISPRLDEKRYNEIKELKSLIEEYTMSRPKEKKAKELKEHLLQEIEVLEAKRLKHKGKIAQYIERAKNREHQGLIAEEERILEKMDSIKVRMLAPEEEVEQLKPLQEQISILRKQMIHDVTAMNISEQRLFLERTKDDLRLRQRKLERVDELLTELSYENYRTKFASVLEPFNAKIEDMGDILKRDESDVAPQ
jgi:hypothetical protein